MRSIVALLCGLLLIGCQRAAPKPPEQPAPVAQQPVANDEAVFTPTEGEELEAIAALQQLVRRKLGERATIDVAERFTSQLVFVDADGLRVWHFMGSHLWNGDETLLADARLLVGRGPDDEVANYGDFVATLWFHPDTDQWYLGWLYVAGVPLHDHMPASFQRHQLQGVLSAEEFAEMEVEYRPSTPTISIARDELGL